MLVRDPDDIRLAMLGMVDGNGHPFSWSAIVNGDFDPVTMKDCGYPTIPQYLGAQPKSALGIPGARVTHVWCDQPGDADRVAKAAYIENVVSRPEDVIGSVDAVIIATDIGGEHVDRARPFVEAGLPVFIDKPLTDNETGLRQFVQWQREGHAILSTSCMRYAQEYAELRAGLAGIGECRLITVTMAKSWERYGIHALEAVYPLCRAGRYVQVSNSSGAGANIAHVEHEDGTHLVLNVIADLTSAFGYVHVYGSKGVVSAQFSDTFTAFKRQLEAFVAYLRTGQLPFPFEETVEQMKIIIAGIRSRNLGGTPVALTDIKEA